ncbi:MAG TPA: DPP IV N-terminal domain-containing protein [Chloroflexota bacterium]
MATTQSSSWVLSLDAVVDYPRPGGDAPTQLAFSPDGRYLTFLWSERGDLVRDLWALDLESGERRRWVAAEELGAAGGELTAEEALRRERQRVRGGGFTRYAWAEKADRLLLPANGQLYTLSSSDREPRSIPAPEEGISEGQLTADGQQVVFLSGRELWVATSGGGVPRRLTFDATEAVSNGMAEFVAQEEMGRQNGFWISPNGSLIAYAQVDESAVPSYPIVHQGGKEWRAEHHRYPFAGGPNARVRLGVLNQEGGPTGWLDLGESDLYLARVTWANDERLLVQAESRDQRRLELRAYDLGTGHSATLLIEESDIWINLHDDLRVLKDGCFIWASECSGFKHLSLHAVDGQLLQTLTSGSWPVDSVLNVNQEDGLVYFAAGRESPLERHIYVAPLVGGDADRLSDEPGFHSAVFALDGRKYAETYDSLTHSPTVVVRWVDEPRRLILHAGGRIDDLAPGLHAPELVNLTVDDGTAVYGALYRPGPLASRAPLIVFVYGGPHAQMVRNAWDLTLDLRAQYLVSLGFAVFKLDNRGSARRGLVFEGAIKNRLGKVEVEDQVAGVRWLAEHGLIDPERVGIHGWSYGGYMTAMCLLQAPEVFRVGVAGAPVTDWDGYDTHYTERYLGLPAENPAGYEASSALTHAAKLEGKLLIVHGLLDENVHFRHTARLVAALEEAGVAVDLLLLPEERHGLRQTSAARSIRLTLERRLAHYFVEHLKP